MAKKKTKRAVVPPLAAVLPHVTPQEFRATRAGTKQKLLTQRDAAREVSETLRTELANERAERANLVTEAVREA